MLQILTQFLRRISMSSGQREKGRPEKKAGAGVERLEDRIAPANNVVTSFVGGTLTITTTDQLGEAEVLAGDNNQSFQLLGTGPGNVTVHPTGMTTVDGGGDQAFTGVVNIVLDVKEGDDFVVAKFLDIAGNLTFRGGNGNNTFNLDSDGGTAQLKNLTVLNGDGVDNMAFLETNVTISGSVTINNGVGGSNVNIGFQATDDVSIAGAFNFTCGAGADNLNFNGSDLEVGGPVTIKGGDGDNSVRFALFGSLVLAKPLTIINGSGNDAFDVASTNHSSSFAGISIRNGAGNSRVTFDSATADVINGNLIVTNGAGDDEFDVDSVDFTVAGMVKIANGTGETLTDVSPSNSNTVSGPFLVTNAAGPDKTTISGTTVNYQTVKIVNGSGDTNTNLAGTNLSFASVSNVNGDGLDLFNIAATGAFEVVTGGLGLKNGSGGSATTIGAATTAAIKGLLSISNGDGSDVVTIGNGAGNFNGLHNVAINHGKGGSTTTFNPSMLKITGSLTMTNGDGFDSFNLGGGALFNFNLTGALKINHGPGGSTTNLAPASSSSIQNGFTLLGGIGNDFVDFFNIGMLGPTLLVLGAGNDSVDIDTSPIGSLKILGGSGNDIIRIENETNDNMSSSVLGALTIDLGSGEDTLVLGLDADDFLLATKPPKLLGGLGLDTFDDNVPNQFPAPFLVLSFEVQIF